MSLFFDGLDDYLQLHAMGLSTTSTYRVPFHDVYVTAWVKPLTSTGDHIWYCQGDNTATGENYQFGTTGTSVWSRYRSSGGTVTSATLASGFTQNHWNFVGGWARGNTSLVIGAESARLNSMTISRSTGAPGSTSPTHLDAYIGAGFSASMERPWHGMICDLTIYGVVPGSSNNGIARLGQLGLSPFEGFWSKLFTIAHYPLREDYLPSVDCPLAGGGQYNLEVGGGSPMFLPNDNPPHITWNNEPFDFDASAGVVIPRTIGEYHYRRMRA